MKKKELRSDRSNVPQKNTKMKVLGLKTISEWNSLIDAADKTASIEFKILFDWKC